MKYDLDTPLTPPGHDFARDSFWWTYRQRFDIPKKMGWKIKACAFEWFDRAENKARNDGQVWPPKPVFVAKISLPMPWDGMNEKPGRVPRTGK